MPSAFHDRIPTRLLTLAALLAVGCAAPVDDGAPHDGAPQHDDAAATPRAQEAGGDGQTLTVPNKNGVYFANVTAQGPGCPRGSWEAAVSDDGEVFTLTFSRYEISLEPAQATSFRTLACNLALYLSSPAGTSYAVTKLAYQGYVRLDPGMTAEQSAYYTFAGLGAAVTGVNGPGIKTSKNVIAGPADQTFLFEDDVETTSLNWSDCATERALMVETRLRLQNGTPKGAGYLNISSIDGQTQGKLILALATRRCVGL